MPRYNSQWIDRTTVFRPKLDRQQGEQPYEEYQRPILVTLCGSTRFKAAFIEANFRESQAGRVVLSVGWFSHADFHKHHCTPAEKEAADILHKQKIDLSDEIFVINVDGYVGDSTRSEILHAIRGGKTIRWLEPDKIPPDLTAALTSVRRWEGGET